MKERAGLIRNSFAVFLHDVKSLFCAPAALLVAVALLILPSLYAWYNVVGFWNPYGRTGNLVVCVVDEDEGGYSNLVGRLNIGEMVVEKLKDNDQLKWQFVDRQEADNEVYSGEAYAEFVIPSDFTKRLLAMADGTYESPTVTYITNEKTGPVSPKITDAGATTLDETINSTFVSTVSGIAAQAIDEALGDERSNISNIKAVASRRIDEASSKIGGAKKELAQSSRSLRSAISKTNSALTKINKLEDTLTKASKEAKTLSDDLTKLQKELSDFSEKSWPLVSSTISSVSNASQKTVSMTQTLASHASEANALVGSAAAQGQVALDQAKRVSNQLNTIGTSLPENSQLRKRILSASNDIKSKCEVLDTSIKSIQETSSDIASSQEKINQATKSNNEAVQTLMSAMQGVTDLFFVKTAPTINSDIALISEALSAINSTVPAQKALLNEFRTILSDTKTTLANSRSAIVSTSGIVGELGSDLKNLKTDTSSLLSSGAIANLLGKDDLDAREIAEFMGAPTEVKTEKLYSPNVYGAAMAPLFMNLTFWIGAFMLIVIIRQEVNYPDIKKLTLTQSYLGRFFLFACMAILQAAICCGGLIAIGVEAANVVALVVAACVTSLSYLSIIYALSVTLQHVGKGICILLIFAQIPGATGLYPVEMTSGFFQAIYPIFPFTYGIEAMRESICGFYGLVYVKDLAVLVLYFAIAMILGIAVRPFLANVDRTVSLQVHRSGIFNGERTAIPPRPFRFSQVVKLLVDKDAYGSELENRYKKFAKWYPKFIRGSVIVGVAVPLALVVLFALTPAEKVVILTIWLVFLLLLFLVLVMVESLKNSLKRQLRLEGFSNDKILALFGKGSIGKPKTGARGYKISKGDFQGNAAGVNDDSPVHAIVIKDDSAVHATDINDDSPIRAIGSDLEGEKSQVPSEVSEDE